jgi:hypothetical protein
MNNQERVANLVMHHERGTLVRGAWHGKDGMNRDTACWAGAFGPDIDSPEKCPSELMPLWFAYFLPKFDDNTSIEKWTELTARFVGLAQRWHVIDAAAWERVRSQTIITSLEIAKSHNESAVSPVLQLFKRRLSGDEPTATEWGEAKRAAWRAADAAAAAAWRAADAAAWRAAWHAADADAAAAWRAAWHAADADAAAAWRAADAAADAAAWDRICMACFDTLESECVKAEKSVK